MVVVVVVVVVVALAVCLFAVQSVFVLQVRGRCKGEGGSTLPNAHMLCTTAGLEERLPLQASPGE